MATVNIRINGKDYQIACDDGQEEHLRMLSDDIDDRIRSLVFRMGANPGEVTALLLASLTMADEIFENKKEIEKMTYDMADLTAKVRQAVAQNSQDVRLREMESAMAETLDDVAARIEKIASQLEIR